MKSDNKKRKKIGIFGNFGTGNLGNESTLQAVLENIRLYLPNADVNCICTGPQASASIHSITTIPMHQLFIKPDVLQYNLLTKIFRKIFLGVPLEILRLFKAFKALRNTDMLIIAGTQYLSDTLSSPFGNPYILFKWSAISKFMRCKLVFLSVGVGPIIHPLSRLFIKTALLFADYRSYRDNISKQYLLDIGFCSVEDPIYPDLTFSLPVPKVSDNFNDKPIIGIGVIDYQGQFRNRPIKGKSADIYKRYIELVSALIVCLLGYKYSIRFVIGDIACDNRVIADLQKLLCNRVKLNNMQLIIEPIETVDQLIAQLAICDIIISPRYHNIIFGLMLKRPVVALAYHEKFNELMIQAGLHDYILDIDKLDVDDVIKKIKSIAEGADKIVKNIGIKIEEYRTSLDAQYSYIFYDLFRS